MALTPSLLALLRGELPFRYQTVPRGECHYRSFSLVDIPPKERAAALRLLIRQWAPYPQSGYSILRQESHALVWAWDAAKPDRTPADNAKPKRRVAETRLYPNPPQDTPRLIACTNGFEGQLWRHGLLLAARWWEQPPSLAQWQAFLRALGETPAPLPPLTRLPPLKRPWGKEWQPESQDYLAGSENRLWQAGLIVFAFALAWQLTAIHLAQQQQQATASQSRQLEARIRPLLQAHAQALRDRADARFLASLLSARSQLEMRADITHQLPTAGDIRIVGWEYQTERLNLVLAGKTLDPSRLIRALSELPWVNSARAERAPVPEQLKIVLGLQPPPGAA